MPRKSKNKVKLMNSAKREKLIANGDLVDGEQLMIKMNVPSKDYVEEIPFIRPYPIALTCWIAGCTVAQLAKACGVSKRSMERYGHKVPYKVALEIQRITKGRITAEVLMQHRWIYDFHMEDVPNFLEKNLVLCNGLPYGWKP